MAQERRVCYSFWGGISFLVPPSRPPMGEVASFAPFRICKMQIHGTDAASEDAFASLLFGAGDIMETLPSPDGGSGILLRLSVFAKCKYTARMRHLRMPSLRSYSRYDIMCPSSRPPVGKWHPLRLSVFAKCKYTARMRHLRMSCLEIGLRLLNYTPFA